MIKVNHGVTAPKEAGEELKKGVASINKKLTKEFAKDSDRLNALKNFNTDYYTGGEKQVRKALLNIYKNKCAYCESRLEPEPVTTGNKPTTQIEHYRPKASVAEAEGHTGYYWLAYEWTNLLPSCDTCNSNKGTQFPITGVRQVLPPLNAHQQLDTAQCRHNARGLQQEDPVLIHPGFTNPKEIIILENATGRLKADTGQRATIINLVGLNRTRLMEDRSKYIIEPIRLATSRALTAVGTLVRNGVDEAKAYDFLIEAYVSPAFKELLSCTNSDHVFAGTARYLLRNYDKLILPQLETSKTTAFCQRLITLWQSYLSRMPKDYLLS